MIITLISDTHTKHQSISEDIPGGDIIIHSGDFMNSGYVAQDTVDFLYWYKLLPYTLKVFIAGNHDRMFENLPVVTNEIINSFGDGCVYLQDESIITMQSEHESIYVPERGVKIYGSPWQPEFFDWAFNLPRNGDELKNKWNAIPKDTDILITHGPPFGTLDTVNSYTKHLGCEVLAERVDIIKPKIHVFGHIHGGRGIEQKNGTLFINAAVLNENYKYTNAPITIDFDFETLEYKIIT
jgi:predicted phosphodiesterase